MQMFVILKHTKKEKRKAAEVLVDVTHTYEEDRDEVIAYVKDPANRDEVPHLARNCRNGSFKEPILQIVLWRG